MVEKSFLSWIVMVLHITAVILTLDVTSTEAGEEKYRFAVVPKSTSNPLFERVREGCIKQAGKLGNVKCIYHGPVEYEPVTQARVVRDFIVSGIDGLAIAVADAVSMTRVINEAVKAGVPVVTFDSDAPNSSRTSYVSTNNQELGIALGKQLLLSSSDGGKYAILTGGPDSLNLQKRVSGVRKALVGSGWKEVSGSPAYCRDDVAYAIRLMNDLKTANPDLKAIVSVGGWPMYAEEGYKKFVEQHQEDIKRGAFMLVVGDALKVQLALLKGGYVTALVGQRPFSIGEEVINVLAKIKEKHKVSPVVYTGFDVVTKDNVLDFLD